MGDTKGDDLNVLVFTKKTKKATIVPIEDYYLFSLDYDLDILNTPECVQQMNKLYKEGYDEEV